MTDGEPGEPTLRAGPGAPQPGEAPPAPPDELPAEGSAERCFEAEARSWIARLAGKGAAGTGAYGLGLIEAVHFFAAEEPERPLREALIARGRFGGLFDDELIDLLARATPIVIPEDH